MCKQAHHESRETDGQNIAVALPKEDTESLKIECSSFFFDFIRRDNPLSALGIIVSASLSSNGLLALGSPPWPMPHDRAAHTLGQFTPGHPFAPR